MTAPQRTPVIAGVAQVEQRDFGAEAGKEPLDLMVQAVGEAALDAGAQSLVQAATSVRVIFGMWPYENPGQAVAERLGISATETTMTSLSGSMVQTVVSQTALDILSGADCWCERDFTPCSGG